MVVVAELVAQVAVEDLPPVHFGLLLLLPVRGRLSVQLMKLARSHALARFRRGISRSSPCQSMGRWLELPPDPVVVAVAVVDARRLSP